MGVHENEVNPPLALKLKETTRLMSESFQQKNLLKET
jgi:hypothetical protein